MNINKGEANNQMKLLAIAAVAAQMANRDGWKAVNGDALAKELRVSRMTVARSGKVEDILAEAVTLVSDFPFEFPRAYAEHALQNATHDQCLAVAKLLGAEL